jgi:hypothetical protein
MGGTVAGSSSLSSPVLHLIRNFSGRIAGATTLGTWEPTPVYGLTDLACVVLVDHIGPAIQEVCPCTPVTTFRWGQNFSMGDLALYVTGPNGQPISPFEVFYTLYRVLSNNTPHQVGPSNRTPILQSIGEYHATGTAGQLGQPGDWQIHWHFRRTFNNPVETEVHAFKVVDSVSSPIYADPTCRKIKYGWD